MKVNRLAKIASVFTEEGLGYLTGDTVLESASGDVHNINDSKISRSDREKARRLKRIFERLGPTFVKFGQMLANRVDLFSDEFIAELSTLHAEVAVFDHALAVETIESELGRPLSELFSNFPEKPVASASIAQVYKTKLKDTGEFVAVKVQRPNLNSSLLDDLELIVQMSSWLDALIPSYRKTMMHVVAKEYAARSRIELDFLSEAAVLEEFGDTYAEDVYFAFPKIYKNLCSEKIIVMEWLEGPRLGQIKDAAELKKLGFDGPTMVRHLFRLQITMSYEIGLIHADMHPGNIIVKSDGKLGIIDCGLNARIPKKTREAVLSMLLFQSQGRIKEQVELSLELSPPADPKDIPKFRQDLIDHYSKPQAHSTTSVSKDIIATMRIGTKYRNYANPFLLMIVRNFLILEGIFLKFDPTFDPADHLGEQVKSILTRRFKPQAVIENFSPVFGELAIALHNRPALLSRILRLESKFTESATLGDFLRSEQVLSPLEKKMSPWVFFLLGLVVGVFCVFIVLKTNV
jgi:ubiquinone biosynthesis protein